MATRAKNVYRIFVSNLSWTISHRELAEYFSQYGRVNKAKVVFDRNTGLSLKYGFVEFPSKICYDDVLNKKDHVLEGGMLSVQPAASSPSDI